MGSTQSQGVQYNPAQGAMKFALTEPPKSHPNKKAKKEVLGNYSQTITPPQKHCHRPLTLKELNTRDDIPQEGKFIESLNTTVTFNVIRPAGDDKAGGVEKGPTTLKDAKSSRVAVGTGDTGRTRVVWDIDMPKAERVFGKQIPERSQAEIDKLDFGARQPTQSLSHSKLALARIANGKPPSWPSRERPASSAQLSSKQADLEPAQADLQPTTGSCPAYTDGEVVEYYSRTHQQWTAGIVIIAEDATAGFIMNVLVNHGTQMRKNVELDHVRSVLRSGELVEVFVHRNGGVFLPAVVSADQPRDATTTGYQVEVEGTGEVLTDMPATRIRRRFPAASSIEVYRGAVHGWCEGIVHHEAASADGRGAEVLPMPGDDTTTCGMSETSTAKGGHLSRFKADAVAKSNRVKAVNFARRLNPQDLMQLHTEVKHADINGVWTRVPLCGKDGLPEWVPSYLIRTQSQQNPSTSTIEFI